MVTTMLTHGNARLSKKLPRTGACDTLERYFPVRAPRSFKADFQECPNSRCSFRIGPLSPPPQDQAEQWLPGAIANSAGGQHFVRLAVTDD